MRNFNEIFIELDLLKACKAIALVFKLRFFFGKQLLDQSLSLRIVAFTNALPANSSLLV